MLRTGNGLKPTHQPLVLKALQEAQGATLSAREIARQVYGREPTPGLLASVASMVRRIQVKEHGRLDITNVRGRGYRLVPVGEAAPIDVPALLQEVRELPNPERSLLSHNERVLVEFCQRLGQALEQVMGGGS